MSDVIPMTKARALFLVNQIKEHATELRRMLAELHDLKGYLALGYPTWEECVMSEFDKSAEQLYRQLNAHRVQENIGVSHVTLSERSLRPLKDLPAELQPMAYEAAKQEATREGIQTPAERHTRAVVAVMQEVIATGGYVGIDGASTAFHAALTEQQHETMQRQREHIKTAVAQKRGELLAVAECFLADRTPHPAPYQSLTIYINPKDAPSLLAAVNAGAYLTLTARKKDAQS